MNSVGIRRINI